VVESRALSKAGSTAAYAKIYEFKRRTSTSQGVYYHPRVTSEGRRYIPIAYVDKEMLSRLRT